MSKMKGREEFLKTIDTQLLDSSNHRELSVFPYQYSGT